MSNFQCPHCGMTNIDCGKDGYKTPREIELEEALEEIEVLADNSFEQINKIVEIIKKVKQVKN